MTNRNLRATAVLLALVMIAAPALATAGNATPTRAEQLDTARDTVTSALVEHGLSEDEAQQRVDQLTEEDLLNISDQMVQEGGEVPQYVWILIAALLLIAVIAAVA